MDNWLSYFALLCVLVKNAYMKPYSDKAGLATMNRGLDLLNYNRVTLSPNPYENECKRRKSEWIKEIA
jgi:hypothetical protein